MLDVIIANSKDDDNCLHSSVQVWRFYQADIVCLQCFDNVGWAPEGHFAHKNLSSATPNVSLLGKRFGDLVKPMLIMENWLVKHQRSK